MLKKSILTPVLSGVLAVSVVGSGAYYFMNQKNVDKDDESSSQSEDKDGKKAKKGTDVDIKVEDKELQAGLDKAVDKIGDVKDGVADQVDTVTKAMTGDLDFSYNSSLTFTPGDAITQQADIKSVAITASAKQKGEASQFTLSGLYDGKTLATANIIGDRSGGNVYAQVPELSSSYMSVSLDQLKAKLEEAVKAPMQAYTQRAAAAAAAAGGDSDQGAVAQAPDYKALADAFNSIDPEALEKDIGEYAQAIADNFPEGVDAEATKGTVDGVSYELATKTYKVTEADAVNMAKAVLEKAKDDDLIKDFLDQDVIKQTTGSQGSSDFVSEIDALLAEMDKDTEGDSEVISFDVMFDADGGFAGFNMGIDGEGIYAVVTKVDNNVVVDVKFDGGDDVNMTAAGVITDENDTLNGSVKFNAESKNNESGNMEMVYTLKDVKTTDDVMTGTVSLDVTADGKTVGLVFTSNSTKDKTDLLFSTTMDGVNLFDIAFILEQTDASDIDIPTDAFAIDLESGEGFDKYAATIDVEGFQNNIKDALGEELYNKILGTRNDVIDDDVITGDVLTAKKAQ